MSEYTLYTKATCRYCFQAKHLLKKHGRTFTEVDIDANPSLRVIVKRAGFTTVPIIYTGVTYVGGYKELLEELEPETDNPTD